MNKSYKIILTLSALLITSYLLKAPSAGILTNAYQNKNSTYNVIPDEEIVYDLSFLWFKNVATGRISFKKIDKENFIAEIDAETTGLAGWVFYRHHHYKSYIKVFNGKEMRCVTFEKAITTRWGEKVSISNLDYEKRRLKWKIFKDDKLSEEGEEPIPDGIVYEDILSAFYKFRYGLYGEIIKGKEYTVYTIPENGANKVTIKIDKDDDDKKIKNQSKYEYLAYVTIPKEIFGTKDGVVTVFFRKDLIPVFGMVKNATILGDVSGVLREKKPVKD